MSEANWNKKKEIFTAALGVSEDELSDFLDNRCAGDLQLRRELEALLAAYFDNSDFIEKPAFKIASAFNGDEASKIGGQFGKHKIIQEIGRGGMGAVYLAERSDGEFEQQVALKIIRQNFAGADIESHFRRERQILASLNHPNIARLLDGGVSDAGELFLVMEYIEGEPLLEYVENRQLSVEDRLRLIVKICRAVAFAHQNLVVHRDIKPSNILVTKTGEPKLLDFGLAKITTDDLDAEQTATLFRAFTPSYASPEQIQGKNITTASDVYSLGVVLYELLTGTRPFHFEGKSIEEILNTVNLTEPLRPSSVSSSTFKVQSSKRDENEENKKSKIENPKSLRGDLDNITLKALRKEPECRYKSVEAFADDLERHLNGLPVSARANTAGYRAAKIFRRNKIAVSAAAFVILALISGLAVALWQADVARVERDRAEKRFSNVRQLSNALLFKITPKIERLDGSIEAREILVSESLKYLDSLAAESANDSALQSELASAYEKIGDLQGAPRQPNLSDFTGAVASYEKAQAIRRKLLEKEVSGVENRRLLALNYARLSSVHYATNNLSQATTESEKALQVFESLIAAEPDRLDLQIDRANAEIEYANIFFFNSQLDRFFPLLSGTLERLENLQNRNPENTEIKRLIVQSRTRLGNGFSWDGRQSEAEAEMNKALEISARLVTKNPNDNLMRQEHLRTYWEAAAIYEQINDRLSYEYLIVPYRFNSP